MGIQAESRASPYNPLHDLTRPTHPHRRRRPRRLRGRVAARPPGRAGRPPRDAAGARRPRPTRPTRFAELVCSNSLRSDDPDHAARASSRRRCGRSAPSSSRAPTQRGAGRQALAVDRERFAAHGDRRARAHPARLDARGGDGAPGAGRPRWSSRPARSPRRRWPRAIAGALGGEHLYFYDAIAPIVDAETRPLERSSGVALRQGRRRRLPELPVEPRAVRGLLRRASSAAEVVVPHDFEKAVFFEGCLPIEEMARRGATRCASAR